MIIQNLSSYQKPSHWHPGASCLVQFFWFCIGAPLLSTRWLPGSYWRVLLLITFGATIRAHCRIKPGLRVKFPWNLQVGSACWLGEDVWVDNLAMTTIGDRVCISQGSYLCTGNHDYRSDTFDLRLGPISIESDSWVAAKVVIAPGTVIGSGSVIGLGSVVSGRVPSGVIMSGNPAVIVGERRLRIS